MALTFIIKHGAIADIPTTGMTLGTPLFATDTTALYIATGATTKATVVPDIASLGALGVPATGDLILMEDVSLGTEVRAKKISFADFKTALNIPAGSTDEKVAVISGGTAGYVWGTSGSDGILRMGNGLSWTKDASNGFVTFKIYITSEAQGDLLYKGATTWDRLAAGATAGMVLQTGGASANPSWTAILDGGTFV